MKKILVFIVIFCTLNLLSAQTPTVAIICVGGGTQCFNTDPGFANYFLNIVAGSYGSYTRTIEWEITPNDAFSGTNPVNPNPSAKDITQVNVNWDNEPNTTQRKVKVTVQWVLGTDTVVATNEKNVTIKHIAPITSASISSGSPNFVSSSGSSVQIPCGTASFTVSVPTPFTDPNQPVTYNWQLPAGWSGSSTSNSITIFPNAGGGGTLVVSARRTDGNFVRQFSINFTRPTAQFPTLQNSLNQPVCMGSSKLFDASSVNATSYSWSASGSISVSPSTGQSVSVTGLSDGLGELTVTADNACQIPKSRTETVAVGGPKIQQAYVNGSTPQYPNFVYGSAQLTVTEVLSAGCTSYKWSKVDSYSPGYLTPFSGFCVNTGNNGESFDEESQAWASTYDPSDYFMVRVKSANECGEGDNFTFYLQYGSGGGGWYRMVSSNPATSEIKVELKSGFGKNALERISLVGESQLKIVKSFNAKEQRTKDYFENNDAVSFDTSDLPRGRYFLHIEFIGGKKFQEIIVLE